MAHGSSLTFEIEKSRSESFQGGYGRICAKDEAWVPRGVLKSDLDGLDAECVKIAKQMIEGPETGPAAIANDSTLRAELEKSFGSKIPAGYTYFGQFVDHDITFDPASSLMRRNDPSGLRNFRTPRLDLDSVYGRGRDDQPYLYDTTDNRNKLLIGQVVASGFRDLPRNSQGRALIGDPRNDDNVIVSQLHLASCSRTTRS